MREKIIIFANILFIVLWLTACGEKDKYVYCTEAVLSVEKTEDESGIDDPEAQATDETIFVYVCGAVVSPGVYEVSCGALVQDVLIMAGGFVQGAATEYINLARVVESGEKIYFPYEDELGEDITGIQDDYIGTNNQGKVNINTATKDELMTIPGIGDSKAQAIIDYREENGAFSDIQEITNISGIKEGVFNNIKDYIIAN